MPHDNCITLSYAATEKRVTTFPMDKYLGHGIFSDSDDEDGEWDLEEDGHSSRSKGNNKGEDTLPEGARLCLDVLTAKARTLRRPRFMVSMDVMPGRDLAAAHLGMPPGTYTGHLPLPDPDLDGAASWRRRVHQVRTS